MSVAQAQLSLVPPTNDASIPSAIHLLEVAMRDEIEDIKASIALYKKSRVRWNDTLVSTQIKEPEYHAIPRLIKEIMQEVRRIAERELSQPGAPLQCDISEWIEEHYEDKAEEIRRKRSHRDDEWYDDVIKLWLDFHPADLWCHLVQEFKPQRVIDEARDRAAELIIRNFGLGRNNEVKRVGSRIELSISRYSEKEYSGTSRRYTNHSRSDFTKLIEAFDVFQVSANIDPERVHLNSLLKALADTSDYDFRFDSRDRRNFTGDLSIVYFNNEVKLYFSEAVAASLNVFLSTYGAEHLNNR